MSSQSFGAWEYVPAGWTTPEAGFWGNEADGRDTLTAIRAYRIESQAWEKAYENLRGEILSYQESTKEQLEDLKKQLDAERNAWKKEMQSDQAKNRLYILLALGVGYMAGN
ncbi:hypothetical protein [Aminobacterium colombiense]|uniref:Uncharacterized protein n=1 Tax=Aminobacterium colombiense (strain DSM 12261 / ALA-1) TaxID=572547 RepID=D5EF89_AMICL|nr:hypothetical protein [Aminobacterium colombiense]ADE57221.1 hypothetical protein Amico_1097 [Aminobacterium colombiense DSM 12261]